MVTFRQPFKGDYPITLDYGEKFPPLYTDESPHRGIDYGTPMRTPILASAEGTVYATESLTVGYGRYIMLKHAGNYITVYAHLDEILVRTNQSVHKGQVIGYSGTSGNSTGPHLHFELRLNGITIDPKPYMQTVLDPDPNNNTPNAEKPEVSTRQKGTAIVVCDCVNVRCHCDMSRVMKQLHRGDIIAIGDQVTEYMGLPFRDYFDIEINCWLRIAEHDPTEQLIENFNIPF